jgi:tRNA(fMet)-specific endonuclease VapC
MAYLFDTNAASEAFRGNPHIRLRIQQASAPVLFSSIAAEETLTGALALINKYRNDSRLPAAHDLLAKLIREIEQYLIYAYNREAANVFASFSAQTKRLGSQDCRIAASAIAQGLIVVTANVHHFSQIPGVQFEDWSR